jgi:hypothetical protein
VRQLIFVRARILGCPSSETISQIVTQMQHFDFCLSFPTRLESNGQGIDALATDNEQGARYKGYCKQGVRTWGWGSKGEKRPSTRCSYCTVTTLVLYSYCTLAVLLLLYHILLLVLYSHCTTLLLLYSHCAPTVRIPGTATRYKGCRWSRTNSRSVISPASMYRQGIRVH